MRIFNYTVLFEPIEDGGYLVIVPALPGIVTHGSTIEEARMMAADAIKCHCEGLLKDGEPLPKDVSLHAEPVKEIISVELENA
ncbi:MAG: type II toxin-antitoxin system HicB family antitoxin [Ignavibacteriae bacterium]|nr:type II toxin-antitoxin system HicB family antitoxin [Ignavibacteriota bacterium]